MCGDHAGDRRVKVVGPAPPVPGLQPEVEGLAERIPATAGDGDAEG